MKLSRIVLASTVCCAPAAAQAGLFGMWGAPGDRLGSAVGSIGDADGDGRADFLVGAEQADGVQPDAGRAWVISTKSGSAALPISTFLGLHTGDRVGAALAGISDLNGDGVNEYVVGAPGLDNGAVTDCGGMYVVDGATGVSLFNNVGVSSGMQYGSAVAAIGDWTGDGKTEYAVGAPYDDTIATDAGAVYLFNGASHTLFKTVYGQHVGDHFGAAVAGAGLHNNDTTPDLIVGAPDYDSGAAPLNCGRAYVYSGVFPYAQLYTYTGTYSVGHLGSSVSGGFDVNADGLDEVIIGEPFGDANGNFSGRAVVLSGGLIHFTLYDIAGAAAGNLAGQAVLGVGDVNQDGKDDFMIGSPEADGALDVDCGFADIYSGANGSVLVHAEGSEPSQGFGWSLGAPGLINADTAADVIMGSPYDYWTAPYGGSLHIGLSNVPSPTEYCTGKINSLGCSPRIWLNGCPTMSVADNFRIQAIQCRPGKPGLMMWSLLSASLPFGGGTLCLKAPIVRMPVQNAQAYNTGACDGWYDQPMTQAYMNSKGLTPGKTFFAQYWMRDNGFAAPNNIGLTTAMQTQVLP
ncbi:MAG: integrin alpha [Planctomycetes bacterium]|nr:integrin alpha [Planctomycetota bacterium]